MGAIEELNQNLKELIGLLKGYPNAIDVKLEPERQNAESLQAAQEKQVEATSPPVQENPAATSTHTVDDLRDLVKRIVASQPGSKGDIKNILNEMEVPGINSTPVEKIDTLYDKLAGLVG